MLVRRVSASDRRNGRDVGQAPGAAVVDLQGYSVLPRIVGMHNHMIYMNRSFHRP
jgi:predicted amidohydrolase YtcJ